MSDFIKSLTLNLSKNPVAVGAVLVVGAAWFLSRKAGQVIDDVASSPLVTGTNLTGVIDPNKGAIDNYAKLQQLGILE